MRPLIRFIAYPLIMSAAVFAVLTLANDASQALALAAVTIAGVLAVAALERLAPYRQEWLADHDDFVADVQYNVLGAVLIQTSVHYVYPLSSGFVSLGLWPDWPLWASVAAVGLIIDFGLYWMHRFSHTSPLLWRFHQPHHSAQRLYWLNGERRHLVSALLLASPGLIAVAILGAPPAALAAWFAILPVHLAFQHANIDYTLGPFRFVLGVAEMHRWHHKRAYEDAQVNFGEALLIWDWLFGTGHDDRKGVDADELGLSDEHYPKGFWSQHIRAFAKQDPRASD